MNKTLLWLSFTGAIIAFHLFFDMANYIPGWWGRTILFVAEMGFIISLLRYIEQRRERKEHS